MKEKFVIIGAGQAGLKAAETLRQKGFEGDITLVGDEPYLPYQRPPLSKAYLKGEMKEERLLLKPQNWFSDQNINFLNATRSEAIDRDSKTVKLTNGETIDYSKLLLTTGTRARDLPLPGMELRGVHRLRGIDDTRKIASSLDLSQSIVILGGGFIGMEFAAVASAMGKSVTILENQNRVLKRVVAAELSDFFTDLHKSKSIEFLTETNATAIRGNQVAEYVVLNNGEKIKADLVLVAAGAVSNTELATQAGIDVERGIVVDGQCRTSVKDIFAAGDCTVFYSNRYGRKIGLESVQNACDQAKAAALSMLGEDVAYDPVPWFWSDQFDIKLQIAGLSEGYTETKIVGAIKDSKFSVEYYGLSGLLAVHSINDPRSHMMARRKLADIQSVKAA